MFGGRARNARIWPTARWFLTVGGLGSDQPFSLSSTDGDRWVAHGTMPTAGDGEAQGTWSIYGEDGKIVGAEISAHLFRSMGDGDWIEAVSSGTFVSRSRFGGREATFYDVTGRGGRYVAVGSTVIYSDGGDVWKDSDEVIRCGDESPCILEQTSNPFSNAVASNGEFVLAASANDYHVSDDGGKSWARYHGSGYGVDDMTWDGRRFLTIGHTAFQHAEVVEIVVK